MVAKRISYVMHRRFGMERPPLPCRHEAAVDKAQADLRRVRRYAWLLLAASLVNVVLAYDQGYRDGLRRAAMERVFPGDRGGEHE